MEDTHPQPTNDTFSQYPEADAIPESSTSAHHDSIPAEEDETDLTLDDATQLTAEAEEDPNQPTPKKGPGKTSRKLRIFEKTGPQATVGQIRDLRLLTKFVKDFEINIKQKEIDDYLGFKERTSRRLRKVKTKSELVAEGLLERHPRADNAKKPKASDAGEGANVKVSNDKVTKEPKKKSKKGKDGEMDPQQQQHQAMQQMQGMQHQHPEHPAIPNGYAEAWPNQLDPTLFQQP